MSIYRDIQLAAYNEFIKDYNEIDWSCNDNVKYEEFVSKYRHLYAHNNIWYWILSKNDDVANNTICLVGVTHYLYRIVQYKLANIDV